MIPKFRVWVRTKKRMIETNDILSIDYEYEEVETQFIDGLPDDRDLESFLFKDVILMQSTGLKDKNGKEIFEGDIITTNAYGCIVSFGEYTYFEDEDTQTTAIGFYLSFLNVTPATYAPFEKFYWDNCEVIGNIHENELDLIMYEAWKFNKEQEE